MSEKLTYLDADIHVNNQPLNLSSSAPKIHNDYALNSSSAISIYSNIKGVLANTKFRQEAIEALGSLNLIEIKVRAIDCQVLVRDPNSPAAKFTPIKFNGTEDVLNIVNKTQLAYQRFLDSQPSRFASPSSPYGRGSSASDLPQVAEKVPSTPQNKEEQPSQRTDELERRIVVLEEEKLKTAEEHKNIITQRMNEIETLKQRATQAESQLESTQSLVKEEQQTLESLKDALNEKTKELQQAQRSHEEEKQSSLRAGELECRIGVLEKENQQTAEEHKNVITQRINEIETLKQKATQAESQLEKTQSLVKEKQQTLESLRSSLNKEEKQSSHRAGELERKIGVLEEEKQKKAEEHKSIITQRINEIETLKQKATQAESQLEKTQSLVKEKQQTLESLRGALNEKAKEFQQAQGFHEEEKQKLDTQSRDLHRKLAQVTETNLQLKQEATSLTQAASNLQQQLVKKDEEHQEQILLKERNIQSLSEQLEQVKSQPSETIRGLQNSLSTATQEKTAAAKEHAFEKDSLVEEVQSLKKASEQTRMVNVSALAKKEEKQQALQNEVERLGQLLGEIDEIAKERPEQSLMDEFAKVHSAEPKDTSLPKNIRGVINSLKEKTRVLQIQAQETLGKQGNIDELRSKLQEEQEKTSVATSQIQRMGEEKKEHEEGFGQLRLDYEEKLQKQTSTLKQLQLMLRSKSAEFNQDLEYKDKEITELGQNLKQQTKTNRHLTLDLETKIKKTSQTEDINQSLELENEKIREKITNLQKQARINSAELKKMEEAQNYLETSKEELESENLKLLNKKILLKKQVDQLEDAAKQNEEMTLELQDESRRVREVLASALNINAQSSPEDFQEGFKLLAKAYLDQLTDLEGEIEDLKKSAKNPL